MITERVTAVLVTLIGLSVFGIFVAAVVLVALAATGGVGKAEGCRSDQTSELRGVNTEVTLSDAWQAKWQAFDASLDAGQPATVSFTESEATSRASRFLESKETPVENLVICFHDGYAEALGSVELSTLADLPGIGDVLDSNVRVRGTIDFSGSSPRIIVDEIEAGNLPDEAAERLTGRIEGVVNDRLDDLHHQHKYTPKFSEGLIEISGTP